MTTYQVTLLKSFSTSVDVEANSIAEARDSAYEMEPNDSIVGFGWEPDGETDAYAVYEGGEQVWQAHTETPINGREDQLRQLLSYCRGESEMRRFGQMMPDAYEDVADKLAEILDGEG